MDSLSGVMTLVVTGVGGLIHLYSIGYMGDDEGYPRFMSFLNLFMASMLILVLGSSLPVMFVGWEGVGLCSYLLIGFWYENRVYAAAGRKAFVVNRIGDFGVLVGMFILVGVAGSFEFADINAAAMGGQFRADFPFGILGVMPSLATVACVFLFLGCTGKSAQIPLYVWLPDAMAGPTPVSALIHAATMVTAGVYLCCRLSPLFITSDVAMAIIAVTGTLTALLAASIAVVQREMKKILAYSTVSQLGFMFAAVGVGFFAAGFFHVFTHAFFKACLFLGAGSVMHAVHAHGDADIFKLGGLKKVLPITRWTFLASCLAIAGFPLTSGFFSKDEILLGAAAQIYRPDDALQHAVGWFTLIGLTLAAVMTAFYMFRLYFLTFTGEYRSADQSGDHPYDAHPHESPPSMTIPLVVLGLGALFAGFLGLPHVLPITGTHLHSWWGALDGKLGRRTAGSRGDAHRESRFRPCVRRDGRRDQRRLAALPQQEPRCPGREDAQAPLRARLRQMAHRRALRCDDREPDQAGGDGRGPRRHDLRRRDHDEAAKLQRSRNRSHLRPVAEWRRPNVRGGDDRGYGCGPGLLLGTALAHRSHVRGQQRRAHDSARAWLRVSMGRQLGRRVRNDLGRGPPKRASSTQKNDVRGVAVFIMNARSGVERRIDVGEDWVPLPIEAVAPAATLRREDVGFEVRVDGEDLVFRRPDPPTLLAGNKELRLPMGKGGRLGPARVFARPIVEATVEVRNAFGNRRRATKEITLPFWLEDAPSHASLMPRQS